MDSKTKFTLNQPLSDVYPSTWKKQFDFTDCRIAEYATLQHFKHHMKTITQREDNYCDISYADALDDLLKNKATMTEEDYEVIKNKVKNNLLKRGLISENVYESYKYDIEGDIVDVAKVVARDPQCFLVPNTTYKNYFYELYISVSYPAGVKNSTVMENMAKILATVELLEKEHYYCKITLVLPIRNCGLGQSESNFFSMIPLFSHRDEKSVAVMSSVLNDRLLRKFYFAHLEEYYGSDLCGSYGNAVDLPNTIKPVDLNEEDLCASILEQVLQPGER